MSSSTLPRPRGIIRSSIALASTLALATVLTACGSDDGGDSAGDSGSGGDSGLATVSSGFKGFDIDIVQAIADGLELELAVKDSSFDALQSGQALNAAQCDIAASAMTITEERKAALDFSDGYYDSQQSLLVAEDSDIASIDDLDGVKLGVQQGTTGKAYAEENASGADIVSFPSDAEMFQAIKAGQVEALLQDLPVNINHQEQGGFSVVETYSTDESYGLAMKKGNTELVEAVNEQLTEMRDDGTYDEIYNTYFATE
jgi:polar amino acid transport system substrate-binding protein